MLHFFAAVVHLSKTAYNPEVAGRTLLGYAVFGYPYRGSKGAIRLPVCELVGTDTTRIPTPLPCTHGVQATCTHLHTQRLDMFGYPYRGSKGTVGLPVCELVGTDIIAIPVPPLLPGAHTGYSVHQPAPSGKCQTVITAAKVGPPHRRPHSLVSL